MPHPHRHHQRPVQSPHRPGPVHPRHAGAGSAVRGGPQAHRGRDLGLQLPAHLSGEQPGPGGGRQGGPAPHRPRHHRPPELHLLHVLHPDGLLSDPGGGGGLHHGRGRGLHERGPPHGIRRPEREAVRPHGAEGLHVGLPHQPGGWPRHGHHGGKRGGGLRREPGGHGPIRPPVPAAGGGGHRRREIPGRDRPRHRPRPPGGRGNCRRRVPQAGHHPGEAGKAEARIPGGGRGDGGQFLRHERRLLRRAADGGGAGPEAGRAHPGPGGVHRHHRRAPGAYGHRPHLRHPKDPGQGGADRGGRGPVRDQRGLRRPVHRLPAHPGHRPGQAERERRRHLPGPSRGGHRGADRGLPAVRAETPGRAVRRGHSLRRGRHGHRRPHRSAQGGLSCSALCGGFAQFVSGAQQPCGSATPKAPVRRRDGPFPCEKIGIGFAL